jgi:hypothetical protein
MGSKSLKSRQNPRKTGKNRRKPVEIRCFPLTNALESRKVNGVRVSETRINPDDPALQSRIPGMCIGPVETKRAVAQAIA